MVTTKSRKTEERMVTTKSRKTEDSVAATKASKSVSANDKKTNEKYE